MTTTTTHIAIAIVKSARTITHTYTRTRQDKKGMNRISNATCYEGMLVCLALYMCVSISTFVFITFSKINVSIFTVKSSALYKSFRYFSTQKSNAQTVANGKNTNATQCWRKSGTKWKYVHILFRSSLDIKSPTTNATHHFALRTQQQQQQHRYNNNVAREKSTVAFWCQCGPCPQYPISDIHICEHGNVLKKKCE